jgi:voltage-gated potassium channel Kch
MRERLTVVGIVLLLLATGLWGQYQITPENLSEHFMRSLYQVMMLFVLEGDWTVNLAEVPLAIELVRFFAPLVALASIIWVFATTTRVSLINYSVRFYNGHIVVAGLGEKCWQFLMTCDNQQEVVIVERSAENRRVQQVREMGFKVIIGDIFEAGMFERISLQQASTLIAFTGNDGSNVELAIKARNYIQENPGTEPHLKIHIHLNEIGLASQLESYPKFFADFSIAEISFFSVYDLSARLLLRDYPPEIFADVAGHDRVHLAIYGFGRLAEKLVIEAALLCHYANSSRLHITVFDDRAEEKAMKLGSEYPHLTKICDYEFVQLDTFGPHVMDGELAKRLPSVTQHIICRDTDEENLNNALMLRSALLEKRDSNAPILVRMQQSSGLAQLLESNTGDPEIPDGLYPFGMLDQVLHAENILTSHLDELAHSIHEMYLEVQAEGDPRQHKALQSWTELPQWERKQNLLQADHWPVRLRAIRCAPHPRATEVPVYSQEEAELQAKMEHNRYVSQKIYDGWRYGEHRLEDAKINPFLLPWSELPPEQRDNEIKEALRQPAFFNRRAGTAIARTVVIGVSGHRPHKMDVDNQELRRQVVEALMGFREEYPNQHFTVLSPLAEGTDRLVAKLAMDVLDASLQVPLPLPYDLYVSDFQTAESVEEFKELVGRADYYYELPMRFGNIRELAYREGLESNEARNKQYALAGAYVIQRCDRLIAIYDGLSENGTGGTSQVVRWYREGGIDQEYLYPPNYFMAPEKGEAIILDPNPA